MKLSEMTNEQLRAKKAKIEALLRERCAPSPGLKDKLTDILNQLQMYRGEYEDIFYACSGHICGSDEKQVKLNEILVFVNHACHDDLEEHEWKYSTVETARREGTLLEHLKLNGMEWYFISSNERGPEIPRRSPRRYQEGRSGRQLTSGGGGEYQEPKS